MAQLIPDVLAPEIKSNAERRLFNSFKAEQLDYKCVVLHSLGVSVHNNKIFGEIDFVVICREGVLCLEVKGGKVSRRNGIWYFTNRFGVETSKVEGPFQQVQGNMHSLRKYIIRRLGEYSPLVRCQYACAVIMPDCTFEFDGIDIISEVLFDLKSDCSLGNIVAAAFAYWRQNCLKKHGFQGAFLSDEEIEKMANLLRGDFHIVPSLKESVDCTAKELCTLTDEQYELLESFTYNPRILVSGSAGTGKTLIAMEQARRAVWEEKSVLYLCYNRNIAHYVASVFEKEQLNIAVATLHAHMMNLCQIQGSDSFEADFYNKELPAKCLALKTVPEYDLLVIDEGQDIMKNHYMNCVDRFVKGGFDRGHWIIFYDLNQNIFNTDSETDLILKTLRTETYAMTWKLHINCRNTKEIVNANILTTNVQEQGKAWVTGLKADFIGYDDKTDENNKLNNIIRDFRGSGLNGSDFIILSRYSLNNSQNCLNYGLAKDNGTLKTTGSLWRAKKNEVRFATISSYKGLEAKIVVLSDVDSFSDNDVRLLNYVAISRASSKVYILYDKKAEAERQNMILSGYRNIQT